MARDPGAGGSDSVLIGRADDLARIGEALRLPGIVTLIGPGGVGKTTLAAAIAPSTPPGGSHHALVDLTTVTDADAVASRIAETLDVRDAAGMSLEDAIADRLSRHPGLLVLDNFEHLIAAAPFVAALARKVAGARLLITSRTALGLGDERIVPIGALETPRSVSDVGTASASALFLRRANRTIDSYGEEDLAAIASVCRSLDGLPLAIELAAAWTAVLSPRAIERRLLDSRLPLTQPAGGRHESLDHVVEASLGLVDPAARSSFPYLAVFAGEFDDDAALAVVGAEALPALRSLAAMSLVQVRADSAGEPRFRLLETIRAAARERLERRPDEARQAELRHARHFERVAERAAERLRSTTFGDPRAFADLTDPNIQVAYDFAVSAGAPGLALAIATWMATSAVRNGLLTSAIDRIEASRAAADGDDGLRADALNALVSLRSSRGESGLAEIAAAAVDAARASGDPRRLSRTLVTLGNQSDVDVALPLLEEAARIAEAASYHWLTGAALLNLGARLQEVHRDEDAIEALEQAAALFHRTASPVSVALARTTIADAKAGLGQDVGAAADYEAAISILREDAPAQFATQAMVGRALLAERAGDSETAIGYLMDAVATIGESESSDAASDLALGATIVFARRHPGEAANAVALVDRSQMPRAYVPDLGRAEATLREHMTASAIRRHAATGRRAGVKSVIDAIERIASVEGPRAQRQLRATYEHLTVREGQVLTLLADGRSDPDIATALGISGKTASVHVANIKAKLGSRSRIEAALTARDLLRARSDGTS